MTLCHECGAPTGWKSGDDFYRCLSCIDNLTGENPMTHEVQIRWYAGLWNATNVSPYAPRPGLTIARSRDLPWLIKLVRKSFADHLPRLAITILPS